MNTDQVMVESARKKVEQVWPTPTAGDCIRFVYQEVAETDSAMMRCGYQDLEYNRNNKVKEPGDELLKEIAQAYLMLITLANILGINLSFVLEKELERILRKNANMSRLRSGILATESGEVSEM